MTRALKTAKQTDQKGNDVNDNIRERKKAEDALAGERGEVPQCFRSGERCNIPYRPGYVFNPRCERSGLRLYGFSREELLRLKGTDVSAEPGLSEESIRDVTLVSLRHHKKKDGTVFPVEIAVSPLSIKGRNLILGTVRDITERNATETVLRRTRV